MPGIGITANENESKKLDHRYSKLFAGLFGIFLAAALSACGFGDVDEVPIWAPQPRLQWADQSYVVHTEDVPIEDLKVSPSELRYVGVTERPRDGEEKGTNGEINCGFGGWPIVQDSEGNIYLEVEEGIYW